MGNVKSKKKFESIYIYIISTVFIIFFSIFAIHTWSPLWKRLIISIFCLTPFFFVFFKEFPSFLKIKGKSLEILLVWVLVILGMLNVAFSGDSWATFKGMGLFLMSGVLAFFSSFYLMKSSSNRQKFIVFCALSFIIISLYSLIEYISLPPTATRLNNFSFNPIPAGSLLLLLSIGPLMYLEQARANWKFWVPLFFLALGFIDLFLIGARGSALAASFMVFLFIAYKFKRPWISILTLILALGLVVHLIDFKVSYSNTGFFQARTLLIRMDLYSLALDIFVEKPIFGSGFSATYPEEILNAFQPKYFDENYVRGVLADKNTIDNMFLCLLAETGILFTATYIAFVGLCLKKEVERFRVYPEEQLVSMFIFIVLTGFMLVSLTFDSLKYPPLNWMFHSILGIIASKNSNV
jgi:hypothetical protein